MQQTGFVVIITKKRCWTAFFIFTYLSYVGELCCTSMACHWSFCFLICFICDSFKYTNSTYNYTSHNHISALMVLWAMRRGSTKNVNTTAITMELEMLHSVWSILATLKTFLKETVGLHGITSVQSLIEIMLHPFLNSTRSLQVASLIQQTRTLILGSLILKY